MIHLLKKSSKPVAKEFKRKIIPIAGTLADFKQEQQQFQLVPNDNSKPSKKKKEEAPKQQKQEQRVPNEIGNAKDKQKEERAASADSVGNADVDM